MKNMIVIGGFGAFASGKTLTISAYLSGRAGDLVGPIKTGLLTHFLGGALAGCFFISGRLSG